MRLFLWAIFALSVFSSCGRPFRNRTDLNNSQFTEVRFARAPGLEDFDLMGWMDNGMGSRRKGILEVPDSDAVIFVQRQGNTAVGMRTRFNSSNINGSVPKVIRLPFGFFFFSMVAFESANMGGAALCALASETSGGATGNVIELNTSTKTIFLSGGTCAANSEFKDSPGYPNFKVAVCTDDISSKAFDGSCTTAATSTVPAVKLVIHEEDLFTSSETSPIGNAGLSSSCLTLNGSGETSAITFPAGNSGNLTKVRLKAVLQLFSDSSCATMVSFYRFESGIGTAGINTVATGTAGNPTSITDRSSSHTKWTVGNSASDTAKLFIRTF